MTPTMPLDADPQRSVEFASMLPNLSLARILRGKTTKKEIRFHIQKKTSNEPSNNRIWRFCIHSFFLYFSILSVFFLHLLFPVSDPKKKWEMGDWEDWDGVLGALIRHSCYFHVCGNAKNLNSLSHLLFFVCILATFLLFNMLSSRQCCFFDCFSLSTCLMIGLVD
jgi:hypothetical protein